MFYAEQATRGTRVCEFLTTPRGSIFLPTCVLFPFLRVFPCFGWFEAVRGRLIGPKTWDRIVGISLRFLGWP